MSPSHGLQLFMNRPSMGPSHRVQSFRNRLLQRGSPMGSQALPANLLWCGLLSPRVRRSWQEPAPTWAPHRVTASFRHPPSPAWGLFHRLQVDICSTMDLHGLQGTACLTMVFSTSCKGRLSDPESQEPPTPSFFTKFGVCRVVSFTSSHSSLYTAVSLQFFSSPS